MKKIETLSHSHQIHSNPIWEIPGRGESSNREREALLEAEKFWV